MKRRAHAVLADKACSGNGLRNVTEIQRNINHQLPQIKYKNGAGWSFTACP